MFNFSFYVHFSKKIVKAGKRWCARVRKTAAFCTLLSYLYSPILTESLSANL